MVASKSLAVSCSTPTNLKLVAKAALTRPPSVGTTLIVLRAALTITGPAAAVKL